MIDLEKLPATMTAKEVREKLRNCSYETLRQAWLEGKIQGTRISSRRTLYHTASVLRWLGLSSST
jgi:hypothetical protein